MDSKYKLLSNVIKNDQHTGTDNKFSKLMLSSRKQPPQQQQPNVVEQTNNPPDNDSDPKSVVNRILRSTSSEQLSQRLELSDSDETNFSADTNDDELLKQMKETEMSQLQIATESQELFESGSRESSETIRHLLSQKRQFNTIARLSQQFNDMNIEQSPKYPTNLISGTTISNGTTINNLDFEEIVSVNSSSSDASEENDENVICISDSESEKSQITQNREVMDNNEINSIVDSMPSAISSHIGLSPTVMAKIDDFFNNIPPFIPSNLPIGNHQNESTLNSSTSILDEQRKMHVSETSNEESFNSALGPQHNDSIEAEDKNKTQDKKDDEKNNESSSKMPTPSTPSENSSTNNLESPVVHHYTPKLTSKINISAKINIKIQIPNCSSSDSSQSSSENGKSLPQTPSNLPTNDVSVKSQKSESKVGAIRTPASNGKKTPANNGTKTPASNGKKTPASNAKKTPASKPKKADPTSLKKTPTTKTPQNPPKKPSTCAINSAIKTNIDIGDPYRRDTLKIDRPTCGLDTTTTNKSKINKFHADDDRINFRTPVSGTRTTQHNNEEMPSTTKEDEIVIDEAAEAILNELYGQEWQTPTMIKLCSSRKKMPPNDGNGTVLKGKNLEEQFNEKEMIPSNLVDNTFHNDFCKDRRNLPADLESTRITPLRVRNLRKSDENNTSNVIESPYFKKPYTADQNPRSRNLRTTGKGQHKQTPKRFLPPPSSSDSDEAFEDSEDEWHCTSDNDESNSDSEKENKRIKPKGKNKSNEEKLIYVDLTNIEAEIDENHSSPNATIEDLEKITQQFLDGFQYTKKIYQPGCDETDDNVKTPTTTAEIKTKRKLFTPNYDYDGVDKCFDNEIGLLDDNDTPNKVHLKVPIPPHLIPVNRVLENIKGTEIRTPGKNRTPKSPTSNKKVANTQNSLTKPKLNGDSNRKADQPYGFLKSLDEHIPKELCDPEAIVYRENFRKKRDEITSKLYNIFNEKVFDGKLTIPLSWNKKLLNTAGRCHNKKRQGIRSSRIELSEKVLTSADRLRCTLIHEMCHASTWIHNEENGHGTTWKKWAARANSIFPEMPKIAVCHQYDIAYKYTYKCSLCGAKSQAHSKSKKVENIRCAYCHGQIEIFLNKKDKEGQRILTPVRQANGFAKFVKDQYKHYKLPGVSHTDVMKSLSSAFAAVKLSNNNKVENNNPI